MKIKLKRLICVIAAVTAVLGLTATAAAVKNITITVDPSVRIKVNGEVFSPKNAKGEDVMCFVYQGTTYAPLRGLAEAYGLNVGWDQSAQMATVDNAESTPSSSKSGEEPNETFTYEDFKTMFSAVTTKEYDSNVISVFAKYQGNYNYDELRRFVKYYGINTVTDYAVRFVKELSAQYPFKWINLRVIGPNQTSVVEIDLNTQTGEWGVMMTDSEMYND